MRRVPLVVAIFALLAPFAAFAPTAGAAPVGEVEVTVGATSGTPAQGNWVVVPITVDNGRLQDVRLTFTAEQTDELVARFEPPSVTVPPAQTARVSALVFVAHDAPATAQTIRLSAREPEVAIASAFSWSHDLVLDVMPSDGSPSRGSSGGAYVTFSPTIHELTVAPSSNATMDVTLDNPVNGTQSLTLDWILPSGFRAGNGTSQKITLAPGESRALRLEVVRGGNATPGPARLVARDSVADEVRGFATVRVSEPERLRTFTVDLQPREVNATAGDNVTLAVRLAPARDVTLDLSVHALSSGFEASLDVHRVVLGKGENVSVALHVRAPNANATGSVTVAVTAADTAERHEASATIVATVPAPQPQPQPPSWPIEHRFAHAANAGPRDEAFVVPEGARGLAWAARVGPEGVWSADHYVVALYDPSGARQPLCDSPCSMTIDDPAPGSWRLAFEGDGAEDAEALVVLTQTLPRHVMLDPWRLEREETRFWSDGDGAFAFGFNPNDTQAAVWEVWRPNETQPDGTVSLWTPEGEERARCETGRCFFRVKGPYDTGSWETRHQGPGVGGFVWRVWVLPADARTPEEPSPPRDEPEVRPPANATPTPPQTPTPTPPPQEPSEPARVRLEVRPAEIRIEPGGSARGVLHVTSKADVETPFALTVRLPKGVSATFEQDPPTTLAANAIVTLAFALHAQPTLEPGVTLAAAFRASGADGGDFLVVVGPAAPPEDDDDVTTRAAPDGAAPPSVVPGLAGAAAGVGAGALGIAWARRRWPFAFAALYAKLRPGKVLDHDARRRIVETVRAEPGIPMGELQRRLGLANGEIAHHLHMLERARVLASARDGQLRRVYPVEMGRAPKLPDLGERALEALRAQPRTLSQLARDLGVSRQALHYRVKKLQDAGRVEALDDSTLRARDEAAFVDDDAPFVRV